MSLYILAGGKERKFFPSSCTKGVGNLITKDGVCYALKQSPFRCTKNGVTYVFSSKLHLTKFDSRIAKNRQTINTSLAKRFKINMDVSALADVILYSRIESRGFLIIVEGEYIECLSSIRCGGVKVISRNSKE